MHKNFSNDDAVSGGIAILILIVGYLFVSSIFIGFMLNQGYGTPIGNIPVLPSQGNVKTYSGSQNFFNGAFDWQAMGEDVNSKWVNVSDIGMVLTQLGSHTFSYFGINYLQSDSNNEYDNTYIINNSAVNIFGTHNDYCIILRFTGGVDQNEVCVRADGFYLPTYLVNSNFYVGYNYYFPYPNAHDIDMPKIRTVYNDKDLRLDFYLNDDELFSTTKLNTETNNLATQNRYYGGVGSNIEGFTLYSFDTLNSIISGLNSPTGLDSIANLLGVLGTILKVLAWQIPESVFPSVMGLPLITMIVIGLPEGIGIFCILVIVFRGVS